MFSNMQDKNGGDSLHSSVVFPDAYKIFYLNRGTDSLFAKRMKVNKNLSKSQHRYSQNNGSSNLFNFPP